MGTPVFQEDIRLGYLILRLPLQHIIRRIGQREGMGRTGETYLVGPDRRMRSDSYNDPQNRSVAASLAGTVRQNGVQTPAVEAALAGETGNRVMEDYRGKKVLSSYAPLVLKDLKWVIVAEVDSAEALQPAHAIQRLTAGLAAAVGVLAFMLSLFAAGRIVRPVRNLTDWSRRIAAGEIELVEVKAPDNEIGLLNNSFREAVKSLKKAEDRQKRDDG